MTLLDDRDLYLAARRLCLTAARPVSPSDLQRSLRIGFSHACRLLEELEGDGLLGSFPLYGVRRWSTAFPVDPARRELFRKARPATEPPLASPATRRRRVRRPPPRTPRLRRHTQG